jgi:rod shape-determining protein MreD
MSILLKQIAIPFFIALSVALFGTVFFPSIHLFAFAPFLALTFMRTTFLTSLWIAASSGLIMDLLTSQMRFGIHSLCYSLLVLLIYHQKRHFFADKPLALSLYTLVISIAATVLEFIFLSSFDARLPFTWKLVFTDFIAMSLLDAVYAFLCFTCPMKIHQYFKQLGPLRRFLMDKDEQ